MNYSHPACCILHCECCILHDKLCILCILCLLCFNCAHCAALFILHTVHIAYCVSCVYCALTVHTVHTAYHGCFTPCIIQLCPAFAILWHSLSCGQNSLSRLHSADNFTTFAFSSISAIASLLLPPLPVATAFLWQADKVFRKTFVLVFIIVFV